MDAMTDAAHPADFAHVETWVFDLDNTIYPARYNLFDLVDARIGAFIAELLDLDTVAARRIQKDYFRRHGTTLRGLMLDHGVDPDVFLEYVHDIEVDRLPPSPELDAALGRLAGRKIIYTNGSVAHAERVLERLGVARHFEGVFDIAAGDYLPKPDPAPYRTLIERFDIAPMAAAMVEDIARNLEPAAALGMTTVWVRSDSDWGREGSGDDYVHHVIDDLAGWLGGLVDSATPA